MQVLLSGSSGLIGSALLRALRANKIDVTCLVRRPPGDATEVRWYPDHDIFSHSLLEGVDGVIHLGGENIASGRWTAAKKKRIRDSRVQGTRQLAQAMLQRDNPPSAFICASAIGFYGDRGNELLDEESGSGHDFLAGVCRDWEAAAGLAQDAGVRVVNLRIGIVLAAGGGALAKMLKPFRLGLGGVVGTGNQYWSWVALDDVVGIVQHCLMKDALRGPVNAVAPEPATNREFTKALGRVLGRPTMFPLPAFAARLALGEMADALLLSSTRVVPKRLQETGYTFRHPTLEEALRSALTG
jgi:hypothetical protein